MLTQEQYEIERAICDKAQTTMETLWPEHARGGVIPEVVTAHPDYRACDNAMRGRVEQYEILRDLPERIVAYIGTGKKKRHGL